MDVPSLKLSVVDLRTASDCCCLYHGRRAQLGAHGETLVINQLGFDQRKSYQQDGGGIWCPSTEDARDSVRSEIRSIVLTLA